MKMLLMFTSMVIVLVLGMLYGSILMAQKHYIWSCLVIAIAVISTVKTSLWLVNKENEKIQKKFEHDDKEKVV